VIKYEHLRNFNYKRW